MRVLPATWPNGYGGGNISKYTSWGGNILRTGDGVYHLFVSEIIGGCTLSAWGENSRCVHATGASLQGPFAYADTAVTTWCHNAAHLLAPDGTVVLFHIGTGDSGSFKNCSAAEAPADAGAPAAAAAAAAGGSTVHTAPGPDGPWTPVPVANTPGGGNCNNPAPTVAPNGTWYIVCGSDLLTAATYAGPWAAVPGANIGGATGPRVPGNYEDPFLYIDPRGNWHVIYHVYQTFRTDSCVGSIVSGHVYSPDGITWFSTDASPYTNQVWWANNAGPVPGGGPTTLATRERPKLFFDPVSGNPVALINGVTLDVSSCPDVATGCVDCKYNDITSTLVQPLATE